MKMTRTLIPFLLAASSATALAQPGTMPTDDPSLTTPTPEEPVQPPPPMPPQPPQPPPPPMATQTIEPVAAGRPVGTSLGLGIGYAFGAGTNLQTPNIASARVRLASGLTFEPEVVIGTQRVTQDSGTTESTDSAVELTFGTALRYPMFRKGKFDLELLGGVRFGIDKTNPDGDDNGSTTTRASLGWGLAVNYWLTEHWDLSVGASNPLLAFQKTTNENPPPLDDSSTTSFSVLAAWDPVITVMMHLFY
ncbi:MAG TPA: hypothetical protein VM513_03855 [Kofleriaceae bacterium]|jgi:hypothetical protein|nr:hypothetical protein [Kofleriaceae bacterium]